MVRLLHALAFAAFAAVATAKSHQAKVHVAKHHVTVKLNAHSKLFKAVEPAIDVEEDEDVDEIEEDVEMLPECSDEDLKIFTKFASDAKFKKVCGADNAEALKIMDFWSLNTCASQECWGYIYESLETHVPLCIYDGTFLAHFLMSRLKVCDVVDGKVTIPECPKETDQLLGEFGGAVGLETVCGADIAKQFTLESMSSIQACENLECLLLLAGMSAVMPICKHKEEFVQDRLVAALETCAADCTDADYQFLDMIAEESLVGEYCGNKTVDALKAHKLEDVDACASPQCAALVYFAGQENAIPLCKQNVPKVGGKVPKDRSGRWQLQRPPSYWKDHGSNKVPDLFNIPACTHKDLEMFTNFLDNPKAVDLCGADNVAALKTMDFLKVDACQPSECWNYLYHGMKTKVPFCGQDGEPLTRVLRNQLRVCDALRAFHVIPKCDKKAVDKELRALAATQQLEKLCGADIAKQFTLKGLSSIDPCDNTECKNLLWRMALYMPICRDGKGLLEDTLLDKIAMCGGECSSSDYELLAQLGDSFGKLCGNVTAEAFKTHSLANVEACASHACDSALYMATHEMFIPACFEGENLLS
ncbi:hypothetical protein ATCC90586_011154 [Pythium insidiosum]|nr:hypothetical protein ATCC90586_011154 [Pythium insidiosum]